MYVWFRFVASRLLVVSLLCLFVTEAAFEKLLGGVHVKPAMTELSKSDRGDGSDSVKLSELIYGRYFRGT